MKKIAVLGLGYVGLPLAVELGKTRATIGFDINKERVKALSKGDDVTGEVLSSQLKEACYLSITSDLIDLNGCQFFIVTVPTPVDEQKRPDLSLLKKACENLARTLSVGSIVVFESTVYPGATEEVCVPILEELSGLVFNQDFYVGYSPERINPGDKKHGLRNISKVISASSESALKEIEQVYRTVVSAEIVPASSIKVAEAAKVIENTQRDINIALINELACIFNIMKLDTHEVLRVAGTKWNFLPFTPGLVGGHCIGVDPYYLTYKAQEVGYEPNVILAGRKVNDGMGKYVAGQFVKLLLSKKINLLTSKVLIMGFTFKENCKDIRNTKVIDILNELKAYNVSFDVFDPWADQEPMARDYGINVVTQPTENQYDGILITVKHDCFLEMGLDGIKKYCKNPHIIYDVKGCFNSKLVDGQL